MSPISQISHTERQNSPYPKEVFRCLISEVCRCSFVGLIFIKIYVLTHPTPIFYKTKMLDKTCSVTKNTLIVSFVVSLRNTTLFM